MSRVLIASVPISGHVHPLLPIARRLAERGHEVVWSTHAKFRRAIEATGARLEAATEACLYDDADLDASFPERAKHPAGVRQLKFDIKHCFLDDGPGQLRELMRLAAGFSPALVLTDAAYVGGMALQERTGTPCAVLGVLPMSLGGEDVAPFGLGLAPSATFFGRLRNRALHFLVRKALFADVQAHWQGVRAKMGLGPGEWVLDGMVRAKLFLQPTIPALEYPRRALPASVRFIGALPVEAPRGWAAPGWWSELDDPRPVVHVTQGTIANGEPVLFGPAIEALAGEDVRVVISTGHRAPESLGLAHVPSNVRVSTFLSYPALLPKTSVMLTNGGYGGGAGGAGAWRAGDRRRPHRGQAGGRGARGLERRGTRPQVLGALGEGGAQGGPARAR